MLKTVYFKNKVELIHHLQNAKYSGMGYSIVHTCLNVCYTINHVKLGNDFYETIIAARSKWLNCTIRKVKATPASCFK